jgi:demethylmenaquinone methyltransferase/2-methoxy-6-polyprenyl-1,4-benzoquinol methylase
LGFADFYGRRFNVSPAVLIPRPETEFLCHTILSGKRAVPSAGVPSGERAYSLVSVNETEGVPAVIDLCTGSGCIAWTLAAEIPGAEVTGVDISPKMAQIARGKFADDGRVRILCGDAHEGTFGRFDCILIYNAFPHFSEPSKLLRNLSRQLKPGGRLTVAHGMSREKINLHHSGGARHVSNGLMPAEELAGLFAPFLTVDSTVSDESMYLVSGTNI